MICPHCGMEIEEKRKYTRRKRRRLPNGFGQISEIKGRNLVKPFRAMVTIDKDAYGKPIAKLLEPEAYFKTYNEAYEALLEYNRMRGIYYDGMTMEALYKEWFSKTTGDLSESRKKSIRHFWSCCDEISAIPIANLTVRHVKQCLETTDSYNYKLGVKGLISRMLNYAVENEYLNKNILAYVDVSLGAKAPETEHHKSYTDLEMATLWRNQNINTELILVQCYSGWRPSELLSMRLENISLNDMTMRGGMKTDAGKDRVVPIHSRIQEIVKRRFALSASNRSPWLFSIRNAAGEWTKMSLSTYERRLKDAMRELGLDETHSPHDARKQFVTMAKRSGVDEYAIKRIVGHAIKDITESVYTDRDVEWLRSEIEKIT